MLIPGLSETFADAYGIGFNIQQRDSRLLVRYGEQMEICSRSVLKIVLQLYALQRLSFTEVLIQAP